MKTKLKILKESSSWLLLLFLLCCSNLQAQQTLALARTSNSTNSGTGRAPQGSRLCNRSVYLITQSEMQASGFNAGDIISEIGFNYAFAQDIPTTSTTFGLYLENSADSANLKSNIWDEAIVGMTQVQNSNITIPAATGIFTIPFSGANNFTYNGASLYVAFDYQNLGLKSTTNSVSCNTSLSGGIKTYFSTTSVGTLMSNSNFRPETYFTKKDCTPVNPIFFDVGAICSGGTLWPLPTTSINGISGTWSPPLNNTATTNYTFTPTAGSCATIATMIIAVNPKVTPTFTQVSAITTGSSLAALPTTSNNGITGTWSPAINNMATTTYTFTPNYWQCANSTTMTIVVNSVAPNISYTLVATTYPLGVGIATLTPINTGGLPTSNYSNSIINTVASGINGPRGIAIDQGGNVFFANDDYPYKINKIASNATVTTYSNNGFNYPNGVAVDVAGNVIVADSANNAIKKIAVDGTVTTLATGFNSPYGVAVDAVGNIFVADTSNNAIKKIATDGTVTTLATGFNYPYGVAVDFAGNVFVADTFNQSIKKITTNGTVSAVGSGFSSMLGLTVDAAGNVLVADTYNGAIKRIATDGTISSVANGLNMPWGIAVDASGNIFVASYGDSEMKKISFSSYSISPNLPTGLNFDGVTGVISGTPTIATLTTAYTITTQNLNGSNSTTINFSTTAVSSTFIQVDAICSGAVLAALPTTSQNGIIGTWSPALNNTAATTYTFTPNEDQYGTIVSMTILVNPSVKPSFTQVAVICSGASVAELPTTSLNGITGTWSPIINNLATTTYTFTPNAGQCASTAEMIITVTPSTENITNALACGSYTWVNNGVTYTTSGTYTGTTANCVTQKLDLTIIDPSANFSFEGINYVVTSPTTVAVGVNPNANGLVVIPSSVTTACGSYAVTSIGNFAFYGCTGLTSVTIPNSVTSIGGFGFGFCPSLTSITFPNSVIWIGDGAFNSCTGLTSVTFPNSVTDIGQYAFANCSALTSVTIPNSVSLLRIGAFSQCSSLTSVTCNIVSPLSIDANVFEGVNQGACSLTVPAGSVSAYQAALVWKDFKSNIPSTLSLCAGAKVAAAIGSSALKFYLAATGGSALAGTTTLVTKTYYATNTLNGIESTPRVPVAITINALPGTVAAITASDTVLCKYIGTANAVTYTATSGASSYIWTVPTGVTIIGGQGTNMLTVDFSTATTSGTSTIGNISVKAVNSSGCPSASAKTIALSTKLPTAPSKVALNYNGVVKTKVGNFVGDATKTLVLDATDISNASTSYTWDLPNGVSVVSGDPATDKTIAIHLGGVAPGNSDLVFKVYSVAGCGSSLARSLTVTRTAPAAPTTLALTNDAIATATKITVVSAYTGKFNTTPLTLTATPSSTAGVEATSYKWVLPSGISIVDASAAFVSENSGFTTYTSTSNVIKINLSGVGSATSLLLKVYGINGNGESLLSKDLTLRSAIPAKPGTLTTASGSTATYYPSCGTITVKVPNVFGVTYTWSLKDGAVATVLSMNSDGNEATISVSKLPSAVNSSFKIGVVASNGTGSSETVYTIKLGTACSSIKKESQELAENIADLFNVIAYPNPSSNVFNIKIGSLENAKSELSVYDSIGRLIEQLQVQTNEVELGSRYPAGVYNLIVKQGANVKTVRVVKK